MSESDPLGGLTDAALVELIRKAVASAGLCSFDSLNEVRQLLAEAATRIERGRNRLRLQCESTMAAAGELADVTTENSKLRALVHMLPVYLCDEIRFVYSHKEGIREVAEYAREVVAAEIRKATA